MELTIKWKGKTGRPSVKPDDKELNEMYQHMTAKEIAIQYDVAESTVKSWIYRSRHKEMNNGK